eukprot:7574509-Alexandrium_andersonii.AAC.1
MVLRWEKPLLGPVYAWAAGCSRGALRRIRVPWAVRLILAWLAERLRAGDRFQAPLRVATATGGLSLGRARRGRPCLGRRLG